MSSSAKELGEVIIVLACAQVVFFSVVLLIEWIKSRACVPTEGFVVDHEAYPFRGGTYYTPIIEFTTPEGPRRIKHDVGLPAPLPTDGSERRIVWHDPERPARTHLAGLLGGRRIPPWKLVLVPSAFFVVGIVVRQLGN